MEEDEKSKELRKKLIRDNKHSSLITLISLIGYYQFDKYGSNLKYIFLVLLSLYGTMFVVTIIAQIVYHVLMIMLKQSEEKKD